MTAPNRTIYSFRASGCGTTLAFLALMTLVIVGITLGVLAVVLEVFS